MPYLAIPLNVKYTAANGGRAVIRETGLLLGSDGGGRILLDTDLPLPVLEDLKAHRPPRENVDMQLLVDCLICRVDELGTEAGGRSAGATDAGRG